MIGGRLCYKYFSQHSHKRSTEYGSNSEMQFHPRDLKKRKAEEIVWLPKNQKILLKQAGD